MAKGGKKSRSPAKKAKQDGDSEENAKKVRSSSKSPKPENGPTVDDTTKDAKKRSSSKPPSNATHTDTSAASEENLKVAVRVRCFNKREIDMNAKPIIEMNDGQTVILNPAEPKQEGKVPSKLSTSDRPTRTCAIFRNSRSTIAIGLSTGASNGRTDTGNLILHTRMAKNTAIRIEFSRLADAN